MVAIDYISQSIELQKSNQNHKKNQRK